MISVKRSADNAKQGRENEKGNVLFLILIAVALFAALSYAVTQSTRSGSRDSSREQSLIGSAQVTQYPAGIRTALVRMIIAGTSAEDLYFDPPSNFESDGTDSGSEIEDGDADTTDETRAVFHPAGGGAPFQIAQPDVMASNAQGQWVFSDLWEITQIGTSVATSGAGNDLIAFLPGISAALCRRINEEFGITVAGNDADGDGVPAGPATPLPAIATHAMVKDNSPAFNTAEVAVIAGAFTGQPYGCYDTSDADGGAASGPYVYYHVMVER